MNREQILASADWPTILSDLHAFKLKHQECLNGFDPPTKTCIQKALNEMSSASNAKMDKPYCPFDVSRWELALGRLRPVSRERLMWAHATIHPAKHPDMVMDVEMLHAAKECVRCERTISVGSLVYRRPEDSKGRWALCVPCRQKTEDAKAREQLRLAKEQRRGNAKVKSAAAPADSPRCDDGSDCLCGNCPECRAKGVDK